MGQGIVSGWYEWFYCFRVLFGAGFIEIKEWFEIESNDWKGFERKCLVISLLFICEVMLGEWVKLQFVGVTARLE